MEQKSDADLVILACTRDEEASKEATNELIRRYQTIARTIALKIVRQEELAYEIVQEAFLAAYLSLNQLRSPERFGGWLLSIVRNLAFTTLKEQRQKPLSLEQYLQDTQELQLEGLSQGAIDPYQQAEEHALQHLLLATIATLTEKERNAVLLFYYRQHTIQEIAALLNISENAVKSRLFKARRALRSSLSSEYETSSPFTGKKKEKHMMAETPQPYESKLSFPRYNQASILIQKLAYAEARLLDQPFTGTEHLLLALLHPEAGTASSLLQQQGLTLEHTREAVQVVSPTIEGEIARGLSQDALYTLTGSARVAQHLQHPETTPLHLLLTLLLQKNALALQTLQRLEVSVERLRNETFLNLVGQEGVTEDALIQIKKILADQGPLIQEAAKPIDAQKESGIKLNVDKAMQSFQEAEQKLLKKYAPSDPNYERIKQVFERSQRRLALLKRPASPLTQARIAISYTDMLMHANVVRERFQHAHHGPEHLLVGILQLNSKQARASQLLDRLNVDRSRLQMQLEDLLAEGTYTLPGQPFQGGFTPEADEAIEYAYAASHALAHDFIGAEHILLGLLQLSDHPVSRLLYEAGLDSEKIRDEMAFLPSPVL